MATRQPLPLNERWTAALDGATAMPGPPWLAELRGQAAGAFRAAGLPHRKVEAWKYTPLNVLEKLAPELHSPGEANGSGAFPEPLADIALQVDVGNAALVSLPEELPPGLTLLSLDEGLQRFEHRLRPMLQGIDLEGPARAMSALNTAMLGPGIVIHIAKDVAAGPMLLRWSFGDTPSPMMGQFRVFLILEDGAGLDLVEQFATVGPAAGALNLVYQADLGRKSALSHVRLQAESPDSVLFTSMSVGQVDDSRYRYFGFDLGGGLVRHEWDVRLSGNGASAELNGAFVLSGRRHVDNHVSVSHEAADCSSQQFFRGVLGGRSRGVFNGRALICPGADGSSVQQSNANLLLSPLAEIDTKPELEIYADEVEASHGATVGQLDENAVFYLRTRGLSDRAARRMMTTAFCHAVTDRLADRSLAERVAVRVDEAMLELDAPAEEGR